jgi:hypothetical protein
MATTIRSSKRLEDLRSFGFFDGHHHYPGEQKNKDMMMIKKPMEVEARKIADDFARSLDAKIQSLPTDKDRSEFADQLYYSLGGLMSYILKTQREIDGRKEVDRGIPPKWMMRKRSDGYEVPIFNHRPLDHIHRVEIKPGSWYGTERAHDNPEYVSHLYGIGMGELEEMIEVCKEHGIEFNITAESTYFPGHTLAIEFTSREKAHEQAKIVKKKMLAEKK